MNDQEFTARLREATAPRPPSPEEVVAFGEGIEARIARRRRRRWQLRGVMATAALAAVAWLAVPTHRGTTDATGPDPIGALDVADWENELLYEAGTGEESAVDTEGLPDEYRAIASIFLEG